MGSTDAKQFWVRYKKLVSKDLPITIKTGIKQATLATWKMKRLFPRADDAYKIAEAINTTVEFLVTGQNTTKDACSEEALEIAIIADKLDSEGMNILKCVATSLELKYKAHKS